MYKQHVRRTFLFTILGAVVGVVLAFVLPKVYESNFEIMLGSKTDRTTVSELGRDVEEILQRGSSQSADTERQVLSSLGVFYQAWLKTWTDANRPERVQEYEDFYKKYSVETARTNGGQQDVAAVAFVRARSDSPKSALDLAKNIADSYNSVRRKSAQQATQDAITYLEGQLPASEKALADARSALEAYKGENKIADYTLVARSRQELATQLEVQAANLAGLVADAEGSVNDMESRVASMPETVNEINTTGANPKLQALQARMSDLSIQRQQLLAIYYPDAQQVKQLDATISKVQKEIDDLKRGEEMVKASATVAVNPQKRGAKSDLGRRQAELSGLRQRYAETQRKLDEAKASLNSLPLVEAKLTSLETDLNIARERYESVKRQYTTLKDRQQTLISEAAVLNQPQEIKEAVSPDKGKFLLLGAIGGLSIGLLLSYLMESLKLRIHTSGQLTELTGLPVAAAVPALRGTEAGSLKAQASASLAPAESYRFMTFAMLPGDGAGHRCFMFTGVKNAVGSFSSALQFAKAAAQGGSKVLIVDGDLIKQGLTKTFDAAGKRGFSNLLTEDPTALHNAELVVGTPIQNLFLLPAGSAEAQSVGEANSSRLESVVEALKKYADVVVFAVPPCDILADASALARFADDICLVVSARTTNYRQIPAAHEILTRAGGKKVSLILTDANVDEEAFTRRGSYLVKAGR